MIGIIGGTGLEKLDIFESQEVIETFTPYGSPSSPLVIGRIDNVDVAILSRHGSEHTIPPTHVNNPANIHTLKDYGCKQILATTACGILREDIGRGDLVIPDQFIDFTRFRRNTFHDKFVKGKPVHTAMADPFDEDLSQLLITSAEELGQPVHPSGTIITIEGPRFSTRAESRMFKLWGADVVNMSTAPECILANEAGIPYAAVAICTDYDCWKTDEVPVSWEEVLKVFSTRVMDVTSLLINTIRKIQENL